MLSQILNAVLRLDSVSTLLPPAQKSFIKMSPTPTFKCELKSWLHEPVTSGICYCRLTKPLRITSAAQVEGAAKVQGLTAVTPRSTITGSRCVSSSSVLPPPRTADLRFTGVTVAGKFEITAVSSDRPPWKMSNSDGVKGGGLLKGTPRGDNTHNQPLIVTAEINADHWS